MTSLRASNIAKAQMAAKTGYVVRPMRAEDAGRVAEVHVQVWREAYRLLMPAEYLAGLDPDEFTTRWRERLAGRPSSDVRHVVGLHPTGTIVAIGSAGASRDEDPPTPWELWAINMLAAEHGTGLADLMMAELVGARACSLWVLAGNARALAFYRRHGFVADGHSKTHSPTGTIERRLIRHGSG